MMDKGPALVCQWADDVTTARGYFVIDRTVNDLCAGGIRMCPGLEVHEVIRLARTMTHKLALLGFPFGGAKAGIDYDPLAPDSTVVLRRFLRMHKGFVLDSWLANEDLGTKEAEIAAILDELGVSSLFQPVVLRAREPAKLVDNIRKLGNLCTDGLRLSELTTGYGIAEVTLETLQSLRLEDKDARVSIQGFGSVGASVARFLSAAGLRIVAIADADGTIYSPDGLDVDLLLTKRDRWGVIDRSRLLDNYWKLPQEDWLSLDVDVLVPAAITDAITAANVDFIRARLVVEGANIPATAEAEARLFERGVVVVPDFVANAGAFGLAAAVLAGRVEPEGDEGLAYISKQLRSATRMVLALSETEGITPRQAAIRVAEEKSATAQCEF
ncbi:MAG: Glu/Leu/Phe/Val dehydrogenase [Chloroflexi bacterium]|nr:Glu/Leu/Phe/Val dehydrogenase [Chloroflexota bacterium]